MSKKKLTEYLLLENRELFFNSLVCICNGPLTKKSIELIIQELCMALCKKEEFSSTASRYLDGKVIQSASITKPIKDLILHKIERKDLKEKYKFEDNLVEHIYKLNDGGSLHIPEGDKAKIKIGKADFNLYKFLFHDMDGVFFSNASSAEVYFEYKNHSISGSVTTTSTLSKGFKDILFHRENSDYLKNAKFLMYLNLPDENLSKKEVIDRVELLDKLSFCDNTPYFFDRVNSAYILDEIYKNKSIEKGVSVYIKERYGLKRFTNEERINAFNKIKNLIISFLKSQSSAFRKDTNEAIKPSDGYLYIGLIQNGIIKIGRTKNRQRREREHKGTSDGYIILHEVKTFNYKKCEKILKDIFCLHFEPTDKYVNRNLMKNSGKAEEFYLKAASVSEATRLFYSIVCIFPLTEN